jgi:outer membrane protein assembly factor BamB
MNNDGVDEIVFGDYNGQLHVVNSDGSSFMSEHFPFDTGNQIWGSPAAGYIDDDEFIDIVITSKSKHLYIFDQYGLKLDYNANQYLMGTPTLGNLDDDEELEVVFGGFSSGAKLFAINLDGTDVQGFPYEIDEKMQKGAALADFNNNGKDDIVVGTDDDNIYLIYDDGTVGFSFLTEDKVRSAPIIIDNGNDKIIVVGSKDGKLYAIDNSGQLQFVFETGGSIYTSPTVLEYLNNFMIFFGNNEGEIFAINIHGNLYDGFPINITEQGIFIGKPS